MTDTTSPPIQTLALKEFILAAAYDQLHLRIGDIIYFIYPEIALELAEALKRHAAKLRPQPPEQECPPAVLPNDS